jgi:hypothetical protein
MTGLTALTLAFCHSTARSIEVPARQTAATKWVGMSDADLVAAYRKAVREDEEEHCTQLAPMLSELVKRNLGTQYPKAKAEADLDCAVAQKQWKKAYRLMGPYEAMLSKEETLGTYGVLIARSAQQYGDAAVRIAGLAKAEEADALLEIEDQDFYDLSRKLKESKLTDARRTLFKGLIDSPHFTKMKRDVRALAAYEVLDTDAKTLPAPDALKLLRQITDPQDYIILLAAKKFEALWPTIETHVGPSIKTVADQNIIAAASAFKNARDDSKLRQNLASAFLSAGRFENVIALAKEVQHNPVMAEVTLTEDDAWLLNVEGYALDAMQRTAEADKVFALLGSIKHMSKANDWVVNFAINNALRLSELGRWSAALEASRGAEKIARTAGSGFARMLVRQAKVCALMGLGQSAEAKLLLSDVTALRKDSMTAAITAMLCAGEDDKAAQFAIEALSNPDTADTLVTELQGPDYNFFYTRGKGPDLRQRLRNRPDVAAAFDAIARDIPKAFTPLIAARRAAFSPVLVK